eukprot:jgi/Botrbrau1/11666/Bobra.168_2s0021.1
MRLVFFLISLAVALAEGDKNASVSCTASATTVGRAHFHPIYGPELPNHTLVHVILDPCSNSTYSEC